MGREANADAPRRSSRPESVKVVSVGEPASCPVPWRRLAFVGAFIGAALWAFPLAASQVLALLGVVLVHEAAHLVAARRCGMWARSLSVGFGPSLVRVCGSRGTDYHLKALPLGGAVDIAGMSRGDEVDPEREAETFRAASWGRRALVAAVGPLSNLVLAVVLLFVLFTLIGVPRAPRVTALSTPVADFAPGDLVVKVGGQQVSTAQQAASALAGPGPKLVAIERADRRSTDTVSVPEGVTVSFPAEGRLGPIAGLRAATQATVVVAIRTVGLVPRLLASPFRALADDDVRDDRALSPIGASARADDLLLGGGIELWILVQASVSILLAVVNLVPLLPLDGGRLALALVEGAVGRFRHAPVRLDGRLTMAITTFTVGVLVVGSLITVVLDLTGQ